MARVNRKKRGVAIHGVAFFTLAMVRSTFDLLHAQVMVSLANDEMTTGLFRIDMLPGREGDCLWIEYGDPARPRRILIDGGRKVAYTTLKKRLMALRPGERIFELLVLSHVDADHIEGLLKLVGDRKLRVTFKDVWFNGERHLKKPKRGREVFGAVQGEALTTAIRGRGWRWNAAFEGKSVVIPDSGRLPVKTLPGGMRLTLLSPTWDKLQKLAPVWATELRKAGLLKRNRARADLDLPQRREWFGPLTVMGVELAAASRFEGDASAANGSSICLLAEFGGRRAVLAGDGHAEILASSLAKLRRNGRPIKLDAYKVSHHGSRGTHSAELMKRMRCKRFLISTDGSRHKHPHNESIARILRYGGGDLDLRFNYKSRYSSRWNNDRLKKHYRYTTAYPESRERGLLRTHL
jgi:beta-lactamase superfamily II metal-dependent hydrolase